ncbi:MAG: DUF3037 domain-containing protein [Bacteroidales bacterium]|nr:DUF3037 domain-containing protein [Bacteroidales bacterium]
MNPSESITASSHTFLSLSSIPAPRHSDAPDANLYEYAVIQYVPRVERGEFINIGLIMMCKRRKWIHAHIMIDEKRVLALAPHADMALLRRQSQLFLYRDVPERDLPVEETYRWLTAAKSAILKTSPSHPGIATDTMEQTFINLFNELVTV